MCGQLPDILVSKLLDPPLQKELNCGPIKIIFDSKRPMVFSKRAIFEFVCEQIFFQKVSEEEEELINQQISEGKVSKTNNIFVQCYITSTSFFSFGKQFFGRGEEELTRKRRKIRRRRKCHNSGTNEQRTRKDRATQPTDNGGLR